MSLCLCCDSACVLNRDGVLVSDWLRIPATLLTAPEEEQAVWVAVSLLTWWGTEVSAVAMEGFIFFSIYLGDLNWK
jgi:hypothetical protein